MSEDKDNDTLERMLGIICGCLISIFTMLLLIYTKL